MRIIGITGSFGSGKTTVARMFRARGAKVFDADKVAHALLQPKGKSFSKVVRSFGGDILTRGRIDRRKLSAIVFRNATALRKLCAITHPDVIVRMKQEIKKHRTQKTARLLVLDLPLLFEARLEHLCDSVVVVHATIKQQIRRVKKRNHFSQSEILRRIKNQVPLVAKVAKADFVIYNQGSIQQTKKQVEELCQELKKKKM